MEPRIPRRTCLKGLTWGAAAVGGAFVGRSAVRGQATAPVGAGARSIVDVLLDEPIRTFAGQPAIIDPMLHGHFVEHLGAVVYDGIWVGPDSKIANIDGIRTSIVESLKKLGAPVIRWPGGCFADSYHWRDGIGPRATRPRRFARWGEFNESNHFGTHEFMRFCRLVGAEPYFCANVGTGTPREFQDWLEYCNAPAGRTSLADERAAGGDVEPFNIRLWGVGNESWGCGGNFTPEDYCTEYRRFTTWLPAFGVPLQLIACGPNGNDAAWTQRFLKKWTDYGRAPLAGWAAHYYCGTSGTSTDFSTDQWYDLLEKASRMERLIVDQWAATGEFDPQRAIRLIIDEWGSWHPPDKRLLAKHILAQFSTMRDALIAALTLDIFHRHADKIAMGNIAQLVNCLQSLYMTEGDKLVETTNYHVFAMYAAHRKGVAVPVRVSAPTLRFARDGAAPELFSLAGSASVREKNLTLTLVHTHASLPVEVEVTLRGGKIGQVEGTVLASTRLNAANTPTEPSAVQPRALPAVNRAGASLVCTLPPASVARLTVTLT